MNKLGFGIIGFSISVLVISISTLIFSYQLNSLRLLNFKKVPNIDNTCRLQDEFSICEVAANSTKFTNLDYNFLFKDSINCNISCFEKKTILNKENVYRGNFYSDELVNSNENLLAATGNIKLKSLKTKANLTIIAFKKIEIESITCSNNTIFLYSIVSDINIKSNSNCTIFTTLDSTKLKPIEKVISKVTY